MINIGNSIKNIRIAINMNQTEFSKKIGITQGALSEIERGNNNPSIETLIKIKELTNINIDEIIFGKKEENKEYEELEIINKYKKLAERDRIRVETYIDFIMMEKREKLLTSMNIDKEENEKSS